MTTRSTQCLANRGADDPPMLTAWSAESFAAECKKLTVELTGDALHKAMDQLCCDVLASLGFGEGVTLFLAAVNGQHEPRPTGRSEEE